MSILCSSTFLFPGGGAQIREQRDEHPAVQLQPAPLLAAQLYGRVHLVASLRRRKR